MPSGKRRRIRPKIVIATPKLLVGRGKPVPEWQRSAANLKELRRKLAETNGARPVRIPPLELPPEQIVRWPPEILPDHLLYPWRPFCRIVCERPTLARYRVRKDQRTLTVTEWASLRNAINTIGLAGVPAPTYQEFVNVHDAAMATAAGMMWGAHTMMGHNGRNFLAWHRDYLAKLETRLMLVNPLVTLPYWNWTVDRSLPPQLSDPADLAAWGVTRSFNAAWLPTATWLNSVLATGVTPPDFLAFQSALEGIHGPVHGAVGGTMGGSRSPADPIFWLHHAFIDKCWDDWQRANPGAAFDPPYLTETLQPPPILTRNVAQVLKATDLGYVYV